jgi:hypothetical protein
MLGNTTIKIQRARIAQLAHEVDALRRENARLRRIFEITGTDLPSSTPDYGLGGHEFVDPISGIDTWGGREGAD